MYSVKCYTPWEITVFTKHKEFCVPAEDFKSFAGKTWNLQVSKEDMDEFLETIERKHNHHDNDDYYELFKGYKRKYEDKLSENNLLKERMYKAATEMYANLDYSKLKIDRQIKFIIQGTLNEEYRLCIDPFGFVDDCHIELNKMFKVNNKFNHWTWHFDGFLRVNDDDVIINFQSEGWDNEDQIVVECVKKMFCNKNIKTYKYLL
jgi:hypothetical protein